MSTFVWDILYILITCYRSKVIKMYRFSTVSLAFSWLKNVFFLSLLSFRIFVSLSQLLHSYRHFVLACVKDLRLVFSLCFHTKIWIRFINHKWNKHSINFEFSLRRKRKKFFITIYFRDIYIYIYMRDSICLKLL